MLLGTKSKDLLNQWLGTFLGKKNRSKFNKRGDSL